MCYSGNKHSIMWLYNFSIILLFNKHQIELLRTEVHNEWRT